MQLCYDLDIMIDNFQSNVHAHFYLHCPSQKAIDTPVARNDLSWGCYVMNQPLQYLSMLSIRGGAIMSNDMCQVALRQFMVSCPPLAIKFGLVISLL